VGEMTAAAEKLNQYLAQGLGQDLQARLEKLERTEMKLACSSGWNGSSNQHGLVDSVRLSR